MAKAFKYAIFVLMKSILINTLPHQKKLYAAKKFEGRVFTMPYHMHERYELTYIIKGKGIRIIGDTVNDYEDGDIILLAPFTPHHWQSLGVKNTRVSAISLFFTNGFPTIDFKHLPEFSGIVKLLDTAKFGIQLKGKLRDEVANKMLELKFEYGLTEILKIISILHRIAESKEYNILMDRGFEITKKNDRERINNLVIYINKNIARKISIQELSNVACMHQGSVNRFFKQGTGFSLIEYINLMRVGKACELLIGTNNKISDISHECGFNNLSNFNRIFKRVKELTPNEYRKCYI